MDPATHFALHLLICAVGFGLLAAWAVADVLWHLLPRVLTGVALVIFVAAFITAAQQLLRRLR